MGRLRQLAPAQIRQPRTSPFAELLLEFDGTDQFTYGSDIRRRVTMALASYGLSTLPSAGCMLKPNWATSGRAVRRGWLERGPGGHSIPVQTRGFKGCVSNIQRAQICRLPWNTCC